MLAPNTKAPTSRLTPMGPAALCNSSNCESKGSAMALAKSSKRACPNTPRGSLARTSSRQPVVNPKRAAARQLPRPMPTRNRTAWRIDTKAATAKKKTLQIAGSARPLKLAMALRWNVLVGSVHCWVKLAIKSACQPIILRQSAKP